MSTDFFTTPSWKKTALGTSIALFASDSLDKLKSQAPILLMGGVHGDEPEGVELANKTLNWALSQPTASIAPWIIIPCLNPDGFKNGTRVNGNGVDLNRNYPSKDWSDKFEKDRYFPGKKPASENEVQGVVELVETMKPRIVIHCHSWKPMIVGTGTTAQKDSQRLGKVSGYEVVDDIGYPTPGSLSSYGWHDLRVPVICIEEQDGLTDLSPIWPRFEKGMIEIFRDKTSRRDP